MKLFLIISFVREDIVSSFGGLEMMTLLVSC